MAKRKRRSYRVASPAIYRNSESAKHMRPEVREALAGEAFEMSTALRMPTPGTRQELSGGTRFPTTAKYWEKHSAKRLQSVTPLKGESKAGARRRAKKAKSYFAAERERARRQTTRREWRVVISGTVEVTKDGATTSYEGTQHGPWAAVPVGGLTDARIREAYRELSRFIVAIDARGRPNFDDEYASQGFHEYRRKGESQKAILYVASAEIETRDVDQDDNP